MNIKGKPNHIKYLEILRKMTPEDRLKKAIDLSEFTKELFFIGLKKRFPELSDIELKKLYRERMNKCHNRVY